MNNVQSSFPVDNQCTMQINLLLAILCEKEERRVEQVFLLPICNSKKRMEVSVNGDSMNVNE